MLTELLGPHLHLPTPTLAGPPLPPTPVAPRRLPIFPGEGGGTSTAPSFQTGALGAAPVSVWDCLPNNTLLLQLSDRKWYIQESVKARLVGFFSQLGHAP